MHRINFGLATLLVILTLLPSSMSIPFQTGPLIQEAAAQNIVTDINQIDDCVGVVTTCSNIKQ